jgi:hypothetical protein
MSCDHENTFSIGGKTSDMNGWTFHSGLTGDGYVPSFMGENSNYLELSVCIDCHQLLSFDEDAYNEAHNEAIIKKVQNAFFDQYRTIEEVYEEISDGVFEIGIISGIIEELLANDDLRYVTSEDCEVFDEGALTADYEYEEV